ncbi:MAG: 5' nucleotidase, NT5C type [Bacillota bacterium]
MYNKLGIDIDGVLTEEGSENNSIWQQKMIDFFDRNINLRKHTYNLAEAFGLNDEELKLFLEKELENIYRQVPAAEGARETLETLKKKGFELILITARHSRYNKLTKNWLKKYDIPYDSLYHEDNKAPLAEKLNLKLFIEDNKFNALAISKKNIPVILVSKYHNKDIKTNNLIYRADSWIDIKKHLDTILSEHTSANKLS